MAPPERKTHSLPPAPFSGRACAPPGSGLLAASGLARQPTARVQPQRAGAVTAVRMCPGSSRREAGETTRACAYPPSPHTPLPPAQGSHHAWADATGSVEPTPCTPAQKRGAPGRLERFLRKRRHFVLGAEINPARFSVKWAAEPGSLEWRRLCQA